MELPSIRKIRALELLEKTAKKLELPEDVVQRCREIIDDLEGRKILSYIGVEAAVGAAIIAASKPHMYIGLRTVSRETGASKKQIYRALKKIFVRGVTKIERKTGDVAGPVLAEIPRIALATGVGRDAETVARKIVEKALAERPSLIKTPVVTAAASIYLASILLNRRIPAKDMSRIVGCGEASIRHAARKMAGYLDIKVYL